MVIICLLILLQELKTQHTICRGNEKDVLYLVVESIDKLNSISDWRNALYLITQCRQLIKEINIKKENEAIRKAKKKKILIFVFALLMPIVIIVSIISANAINRSKIYSMLLNETFYPFSSNSISPRYSSI